MRTYELHITEEGKRGGEILEVYASSAAQAIRYYARDMSLTVFDLLTTETDGRSIETIITDKTVSLVWAEAEVGTKDVQAATVAKYLDGDDY
jgi:hypothetical protein